MQNWSAKVEYLYTGLSGFNNNGGWNWIGYGWGARCGGNRNRQYRFNTVRTGVNWHCNFRSGGAAPVVARY